MPAGPRGAGRVVSPCPAGCTAWGSGAGWGTAVRPPAGLWDDAPHAPHNPLGACGPQRGLNPASLPGSPHSRGKED